MLDGRIGPYKFIRKIGEDGLGEVFEAIDLTSKKHVAIKALHPEAANRPEVVSSLYLEAKTLALLNHPNIARIFGFMRRNDQLYLVMEFVEGKSVRAILKEKHRLGPTLSLGFLHQILSAVGFAHELGVLHGHLQPSNIVVTNFGQIKVLDFATATILGSYDSADSRDGMVRYLSPEQIRQEPIDVRSDIYSLGILLYEFIVGRPPFNRDGEVAPGALESMPLLPSLLVANCPRWLDAFVLRALAPSPAERFQSIAAMSQALGSPVEAQRAAKHRRAWLQRGTGWVTSRPAIVFSATHQMGRSISGITGSAAKVTRQKRAGMTRTLQRGLASINPVAWCQRGALRINGWTHGMTAELDRLWDTTNRALTTTIDNAIETTRQKNATLVRAARGRLETLHPLAWAKRGAVRLRDRAGMFQPEPMRVDRLFGSLKEKYAATIDNAIEMTRQKNATLVRAARGRLETLHPLAWAKRGAVRLRDRAGMFQPEPMRVDRLFGSLKEKYTALAEGGWQRYAAITIVFASILIETFIFGGTNTLLQPDDNPLPVTTQNGAAQSLLDQLDPTPRVASAPDLVAKPQPKPAKRMKVVSKTSAKPSGVTELLHDDARTTRRTVTYRSDWYDFPRPGLQASGAGDLSPRKNLENTGAKKQLNVKWEN